MKKTILLSVAFLGFAVSMPKPVHAQYDNVAALKCADGSYAQLDNWACIPVCSSSTFWLYQNFWAIFGMTPEQFYEWFGCYPL